MHKPKKTLRVRFDFNQVNENNNEILLYLCMKISSPAVSQKLKSHDSNVLLQISFPRRKKLWNQRKKLINIYKYDGLLL